MNPTVTLSAPEGSKTVTPWPKGPEIHPAHFVAGAKDQWPGLPRKNAVACHLEKSDRKSIAGIIERFDAALALRETHNIPGKAQEIRDTERNASSSDDQAVLCEKLKREMALMNPALFTQAVADIASARLESGIFAAGLAERLSEKLFTEFEIEAASTEARYLKYGQTLTEQVYRDSWNEVFVLHSDPILTSLFLEVWFLKNYFPGEMRSPKMWGGCSVQWLRDLVEG